jgi:hypothetical protein
VEYVILVYVIGVFVLAAVTVWADEKREVPIRAILAASVAWPIFLIWAILNRRPNE